MSRFIEVQCHSQLLKSLILREWLLYVVIILCSSGYHIMCSGYHIMCSGYVISY